VPKIILVADMLSYLLITNPDYYNVKHITQKT
jgi:hypothetical protein